jgi:hypothetical protein
MRHASSNTFENPLSDDIKIMSLLVSKDLKEAGSSVKAPSLHDYRIIPGERYMNMPDLTVSVVLSNGLHASVVATWGKDEDRSAVSLAEISEKISEAIRDLECEAEELAEMRTEVLASAKREVAKGRRQGLRYRLISVGPETRDVYHNGFLGIEVRYEALDEALRTSLRCMVVQRGEEVVDAFKLIRDDQSRRAQSLAAYAAGGGIGGIEAVVMAALEDAGVARADVLDQLRSMDGHIIDVVSPGGKRFVLYWEDGIVTAKIRLADGVTWNCGTLSFESAPCIMDARLDGKPITDVYSHPFLGRDATIAYATGLKGGGATIRCELPPVLIENPGECLAA